MSPETDYSAQGIATKTYGNFWVALIPIVTLVVLLVVNVQIYSDNASYGPNQIALLLAASVAAFIGLCEGTTLKWMMDGIVSALGSALGAILILLMIGALAGTWMMSGIVPAMIYYGLQVLSPEIFLIATVIVCAVVSIATGSSWSTVATAGVALLAIGKSLGISEPMTAGAIISGAYFGDKISPLSDTTNLAAAMAGTDLFTHIRYMLWTTVPSILITLVIFGCIGFSYSTGESSTAETEALTNAIANKFYIGPVLFVVPAIVVAMVLMKIDAMAALMVGTVLGGVFGVIFQPDIVKELVVQPKQAAVSAIEDAPRTGSLDPKDEDYLKAKKELEGYQNSWLKRSYVFVVDTMYGETKITTENSSASDLLKGKGMSGMLNTIWLIVTAMCFGGVMEAAGLLRRITQPLIKLANSTGALFATTAGSCIFVNLTASDQYLSLVVPGRMFKDTYEARGLAPENLSRTLEDSGTVTSVLIPWNTCGAAQFGVLGVATLAYAPYCFFNIISPIMTLVYGFIGLKIARLATQKNDPNK